MEMVRYETAAHWIHICPIGIEMEVQVESVFVATQRKHEEYVLTTCIVPVVRREEGVMIPGIRGERFLDRFLCLFMVYASGDGINF